MASDSDHGIGLAKDDANRVDVRECHGDSAGSGSNSNSNLNSNTDLNGAKDGGDVDVDVDVETGDEPDLATIDRIYR